MMNKVPVLSPRHRSLRWVAALACSAALLATSTAGVAQSGGGPSWRELNPQEQQILQPLQTQWTSIDALRRQKWRDIAALYPNLPASQQERLRSRMAEWAAMTPVQRNAARLNYEEVKKLPQAERLARWEAYQNLSEEQRRALTEQAVARPQQASAPIAASQRDTTANGVQPKSNIVPNTIKAEQARPTPVAPGTVQAAVGASTRPISKTPTPPRHQQPGLPKIAATPEFVDSETLLPQRGPQGVDSSRTSTTP